MNFFDVFLLIMLALSGLAGYRRGLLRTVYAFVSFFAALVITGFLYIPLTALLRMTPLYSWLKRGISGALSLDEIYARVGESLIEVLPVHEFVQETLHINNNINMHNTLGVSNLPLPDYVAAFFANLVLIAISILVIFIASLILLSLAGAAVDVVGRLPVISRFNNAGGLVVGLAIGVFMMGLGLFVMTLVFSSGTDSFVQNILDGSLITRSMRDNFFPQFFGSIV